MKLLIFATLSAYILGVVTSYIIVDKQVIEKNVWENRQDCRDKHGEYFLKETGGVIDHEWCEGSPWEVRY